MKLIEILVILIFLLLSVPGFCARIGRPALLYAIYLLVGSYLGPWLNDSIKTALSEVGMLGFVLLLFDTGLEIDLPPMETIGRSLRPALTWSLLQLPFLVWIAKSAGLTWTESLLGATALAGCSVGVIFPGWMTYKAHPKDKERILTWLILLELLVIIVLSAGGAVLKLGLSWRLLVMLLGIIGILAGIGLLANRLTSWLGYRVLGTMKYKVHSIFLFIFIVAALGDRLGLSAAKTAFFLGLFISRTTHEGLALAHHLRPVSQLFLIPIFFIHLGSLISADSLSYREIGWALLGTGGILLLRRYGLQRFLPESWGKSLYLLATPNMTLAAIAAIIMTGQGCLPAHIGWVVLMGFLMTIGSLLLLPAQPPPRRSEEFLAVEPPQGTPTLR